MKALKLFFRRLYFRHFLCHRVLEREFVNYTTADYMIRRSAGMSSPWEIDGEREDTNQIHGMVHLCRRERILE